MSERGKSTRNGDRDRQTNFFCINDNDPDNRRFILKTMKGGDGYEVFDNDTGKVITTKYDYMTAKSYKDKLNCGMNPNQKFMWE